MHEEVDALFGAFDYAGLHQTKSDLAPVWEELKTLRKDLQEVAELNLQAGRRPLTEIERIKRQVEEVEGI